MNPSKEQPIAKTEKSTISLRICRAEQELSGKTSLAVLVRFFHRTLKPYEDSVEDITRALTYAFDGTGGFLVLAQDKGELIGALLMLRTGMGGYVPENLLLFVGVRPEQRGKGVGGLLVERGLEEADGTVKLHVEYDNPAKRLYERIGFVSNYAEMRCEP